jgi:hypothetical protein
MTGLTGTSGVIAPGHSGNTFTYLPPNSAAAKTVPATDTWHQRPASDAYRQEWDSFARDLGVHPHVASSFPVITDALHRYADKVITAAARGVAPRASAKAEAVRDAALAAFAPVEVSRLATLTAKGGPLDRLAQQAAGALKSDPGLQHTDWGRALAGAATLVKTDLAFTVGVAEGVFTGGKNMVVGLATFAGKAVQYRADNSNAGRVMDAVRSQLPSDAQAWMKDSALIPSAQRGAASTQKIIDTGAGIASYIKTNTPGQVAGDVKAVISKNWDALKADHAKAAAQGPEAEARWRGNITGRAVFEIAAVFVPVTKAAQLAKLDKLADAAKVAGKLDDVADAAKAVGGKVGDIDIPKVPPPRFSPDILLQSRRTGIPPEKIQELLDLKKAGKELPDPSTYMSKEQIAAHLAKFDEGIVRITSRSSFEKYDTLGPTPRGIG